MTLRGRIAYSMLAVVGISGGVSTLIGGYLLHRQLDHEARNRVQQDLNAAREFYAQRLEAMGAALRFTALGQRFTQAVAERDLSYIPAQLDAVRRKALLDVLCVTDPTGNVIWRAHQREVSGDSLAGDPLVNLVLSGQDVAAGTVLIPMADLEKEDPALARRAAIPIVPTPRAAASESTQLAEGMMLCAAAPVRTQDGRLVGVLRAGILLNRNYELVDQVRDTVFRDERYRGKLVGTATIFQHDVRVSTNVLLEDGSRAVGSRVSAEVEDYVLHQGKTWVGSAWVVNDWYISAYAPIYDTEGRGIGMIYVGVLEKKFRALTIATLTIFGLVALGGLVIAGVVLWRLADRSVRPIRKLATASAAIAQGDFSQALPVESGDAIGLLTESFNTMARSLRERDELLKERTRQYLTRSERLASIGRLAAGVAHEINNPLTGVLTFAHLLRENATEGSQEKKDLDTIIEATMRCKDIVRGLLNFSRQNEPHKRQSDLNGVLRGALNLTRNQASIHRVNIVEGLAAALPQLVIDPDQIQEVAVNVIVNAIDAMPDGGEMTVRTRSVEDNGAAWAEFEIADTGCGIPPENLERVLDPFFTTKQTGKGTGLGLAVSYGIVTEHGGQIRLASEVGRGTTVTVCLPVVTDEREAEPEGQNPT
jgi:two-component system NtrC family sensor kinase